MLFARVSLFLRSSLNYTSDCYAGYAKICWRRSSGATLKIGLFETFFRRNFLTVFSRLSKFQNSNLMDKDPLRGYVTVLIYL